MSNTELKPCPICGAKLKRKVTFKWKEVVDDHPRNGCKNEGVRIRSHKDAIEAWEGGLYE